MKKLILTLVLIVSVISVIAQPNLISKIEFHKAYLDVPIVKKASMTNGQISDEMLDYIFKKSNPTDVKIALVNALSKGQKLMYTPSNNEKVWNYLNANYDNIHSLDKILEIFGNYTTMCVAFLRIHFDLLDDEALGMIRKIYKQIINENNVPKSLLVAYYLAELEHSMGYVGDCTPMGTQEGFMLNIKELMRLITTNQPNIKSDVRPNATKIIQEYLSEYDKPAGAIKVINKSSRNAYKLYVEGKYVVLLKAKESYEFWDIPGLYSIKVESPSGKLIYDNSMETLTDSVVKEIEIGY